MGAHGQNLDSWPASPASSPQNALRNDLEKSFTSLTENHAMLANFFKNWQRQEDFFLEDLRTQVQCWGADNGCVSPPSAEVESWSMKDSTHSGKGEERKSRGRRTKVADKSPRSLGEQFNHFLTASTGLPATASSLSGPTRASPSSSPGRPADVPPARTSFRRRPSKVLGSMGQMCSQLKMSPKNPDVLHQESDKYESENCFSHQLSSTATRSSSAHANKRNSGLTMKVDAQGTLTPVIDSNGLSLRERLEEFIDSAAFEVTSCVVIITNVVYILLDSQAHIDHQQPLSAYNDIFEWLFCAFYVLEMSLRVFVPGLRKFVMGRWTWKIFDLLLIAVVVFERISSLFDQGDDSVQSVASLRGVRIVRCVLCFRVIMILRSFRELRMIASTIIGSLKPLMWSFILLLLITVMFGTLFVQATASFMVTRRPEQNADAVLKHWGSLGRAMISLYMSVTGGDDWVNFSRPLENLPGGWIFVMMFMFYIAFYIFVILNTLTSLFVASTLSNAEEDDLQLILGELKQKEQHVKHFTNWFKRFDQDFSGDVSMEEFNALLLEPEIEAFAVRMGMDIMDMHQFFTLLSGGGKYLVNLERFVVGCIKLKGSAKSLDLMDLIYWHSKGMEDQRRFETISLQRMADMDDKLLSIQSSVLAGCQSDYIFQGCQSRAIKEPASPRVKAPTLSFDAYSDSNEDRRGDRSRSSTVSVAVVKSSNIEEGSRDRVWSSSSTDKESRYRIWSASSAESKEREITKAMTTVQESTEGPITL